MSPTTGCTSYRLYRLLSFFTKNVFVSFLSVYSSSICLLFSYSWKKTVFLYSFFFTNIWGQHTSIIYILYNTAETGIYEQIQQQQQLQPSSHVITCGTYSIALSSNYLSCLRKTGTYTNEKTRFIEIIIMALSSAYILHIYIYTYMCITILKISRSTTRHYVMWNKVTIDRSNVRYEIYLFVD